MKEATTLEEVQATPVVGKPIATVCRNPQGIFDLILDNTAPEHPVHVAMAPV